jgi:hypothetical protein
MARAAFLARRKRACLTAWHAEARSGRDWRGALLAVGAALRQGLLLAAIEGWRARAHHLAWKRHGALK